MKIKLGVIFGGESVEHEVSIISALQAIKNLNEDKYAFIPILRAGMGLLDGVVTVVPNAKIGHIGMYRDEKTKKPVNYFFKVPAGIDKKEVFLLDPMLATGGSACDAIELLQDKGVKKIKFICLIASPEGIEKVRPIAKAKYIDICNKVGTTR